MIEIDFRTVFTEDLEGNKIFLPHDFLKTLGNRLYVSAPSIEVADVARKLHSAGQGMQLSMSMEEVEHLLSVFDSARLLGYPMHNKVKEFLTLFLTPEHGNNITD